LLAALLLGGALFFDLEVEKKQRERRTKCQGGERFFKQKEKELGRRGVEGEREKRTDVQDSRTRA
jgi:hypothetical protein